MVYKPQYRPIEDALSSSFIYAMPIIKYIVFFILHVFAFNYLFVENTVPISFLLLLFLHISFIGLAISELHNLNLSSYRFEFIYHSSFKMTSKFFKELIANGPIIGWLLLLFGFSMIVSVFNRLGFYNDKSGDSTYLGEPANRDIFFF